MTHVITGTCCKDAACVAVCPVNCIHPTPEEGGFASAEILYIDPSVCIDCGACIDACPVAAVTEDHQLVGDVSGFQRLADVYFAGMPPESRSVPAVPNWPPLAPSRAGEKRHTRVAVVGSGPAGMYAINSLIEAFGDHVTINLIESLPTPGGLIRYGVAPDHWKTKQIGDLFNGLLTHPQVTPFFGVTVGIDVSCEELMSAHDAVIYAVGAPLGQRAQVEGADLPGSYAASEFVGWYNGHPNQAGLRPDLSDEHAVIIGNGNVALDVARILTAAPGELAGTDISPAALDALAKSNVRSVTVLGRRGPESAAFTTPELMALIARPGVELRTSGLDVAEGATSTPLQRHRIELLQKLEGSSSREFDRAIELRFWSRPLRILGSERVTGLEVSGSRSDKSRPTELLRCGLVISAIGHKRAGVDGLPRAGDDDLTHEAGRVIDPSTGTVTTGVYAVGWFKRGPSGQIGDNKKCARETVRSLFDDAKAGRLLPPRRDLASVLGARAHIGLEGWQAIDAFERRAAHGTPAPRRKLTDRNVLEAVARGTATSRATL
jgi:ferredoxin--NADP+ reductase